MDTWQRGALHVWREPVPGREYIIGVDAAEGMGGENDNRCFEVIDEVTCEQVAEFYSNLALPYDFAQILAMVGRSYNNALIITESQNSGLTVLDKLQHDFYYESIFESAQGTNKNPKTGIKTTLSNRPKFLENIQTRLINNSIAIRSRRFVKELKGFIWNSQTKKAQATKGFHDDAIMAMCLALYARESRNRQLPAGAEQEEYTEKFKADIYEEIKKELAKNAPEDWLEDQDLQTLNDPNREELPYAIAQGYRRERDAILKEFGW